ncbi:hypothetical protein JNUCC42_11110 [Brevibacterium sp. JNUCC-42]|nr:hypothetical protein JNUCC42_11110 [Brevibacterium sp. JNUCC-42]
MFIQLYIDNMIKNKECKKDGVQSKVVDPILPVIAEQIHATHWQVEMLFTVYIFTMVIMMLPSGILDGAEVAVSMSIVAIVIISMNITSERNMSKKVC